MKFTETPHKKDYIYKGKILNLRRDDVILTNGNKAVREIIEHSGGSAILVEKDDKILFVKQYRYACGEEVLEIPAGKLNAGEDPLETARRELEEESGIIAGNLQLMFEVYPSPGYTQEKIWIYKATDLKEGKVNLDEDEFLSLVWIEKEQVRKLIKDGTIKDGKTLLALLSIL